MSCDLPVQCQSGQQTTRCVMEVCILFLWLHSGHFCCWQQICYWCSSSLWEKVDLLLEIFQQNCKQGKCRLRLVVLRCKGWLLFLTTISLSACADELRLLCPPVLEKHAAVQEGIPTDAIDLECPDHGLKFTVLQEFLILDDKYNSRIDDLQMRHALALKWVSVVSFVLLCQSKTCCPLFQRVWG